jgi:hypothetical protein
MLRKPIWCKCKKHSWTRRQLYAAWEKGRDVMCPDPTCQRTIPVETVETLLVDLGMVFPDDNPPEVPGQG